MTPLRPNSPTECSRRTIAFVLGLLAGTLPAQNGREGTSADAMIFHAFPEADSYRQIVRDVDQQARTAIEQQLPFKVHFDELGPHTLFVAFRGRKPVGLLYLRHEEAEWGLTEIAWTLSLDLRVLGFQFQRGRSRHQRELELSAFAKQLVGANLSALEELLADRVEDDTTPVPEGAEELARMVLRSGTKALLVTDTVWRDEIAKLQDLGMGFDAFPTAEEFHRKLVQFDLTKGDTSTKVSASVVRATGKGKSQLGAVVRTEVMVAGNPLVLRWIVDGNLRIMRIAPAQSWASDELRLACSQLEGQLLVSPTDSDNQLGSIARGLGDVMRRLGASRGLK